MEAPPDMDLHAMIKELIALEFNVKNVPVHESRFLTEEQIVSFYNPRDRMKYWNGPDSTGDGF